MYKNNTVENQTVSSFLWFHTDFKEKQQQFTFLVFLLINSQFSLTIRALLHCKQGWFIYGKFKLMEING